MRSESPLTDPASSAASASARVAAVSESGELRFMLGVQKVRGATYLFAGGLALLFKLFGVLEAPYAALFGAMGVLSAAGFYFVYERRLDQRWGFEPHRIWMPLDIGITTLAVYLTGGASSPWFLFYIVTLAAAAFVGTRRTAALAAAANTGSYLGVLAWMGEFRGLDESFYLPLLRIVFLHAGSITFVQGATNLRDKRLRIKRLQAEQALRVEELMRLTKELSEANVQIREADRIKSQFLANMSHELRTPLNAIIGFSEILMGPAGQDEARRARFLGNVHASGQHLLGIISDILDLSKIEAGKMEFDPEPLDVRGAVEGVAAVMQGMAAGRRINFEVDVPVDLPQIETDPVRFKQVLYNLLSNAVKFSPEDSTVTVLARALPAGSSPLNEESLRVSVVDWGIGISPADQEVIFHEFRQADSATSRQAGGTGLGLALVKRFVELQGGVVTLKSEIGRGSTFSFTLPSRARAGSADTERMPPPKPLPTAGRVLVVEDDVVAFQSIARSLREAGYFPVQAQRGEEALRLARTLKPSLITLDIGLPDISGLEVLGRLKGDPSTDATPVVIVSVLENRELGLAFGADDCFVKPVDRERLLRRLRELAPPAAPSQARLLLVDDDPAVHDLIEAELSPLGYVVEHAFEGSEALALAERRAPDVIVLDLLMPHLGGFEVAAALKRKKETADIPVIILTAKDLSVAERASLQGNSAGLVQKGEGAASNLLAAIGTLERHGAEARRLNLAASSPPRPEAQEAPTGSDPKAVSPDDASWGREGGIAPRFSRATGFTPVAGDDSSSSPLVLFVEDDPIGREVFEAMLGEEGYRLVAASDGPEALARARECLPDVILLDVMMPGMDGYEVLRRLRADAHLADVPVVMVTALADTDSRLRGIEAGADDFLTKPIDRLQLRARVRTVTRLNRFRKLLTERGKFEWAVESADDGFLLLDGEDGIVYANPRARLFLGLEADATLPTGEGFVAQARKLYRCEPEEAWEQWPAAAAGTVRYLVRPESAGAQASWLQVDSLPLPAGSEAGRLVRLKDVTERLQAQREAWAFHSAINHKLRTPLTTVLLALEYLSDTGAGHDPETTARLAQPALRSARRLAGEIQDILGFVEAARRPWAGGDFGLESLPELVTRVAAELGVTSFTTSVAEDLAGARIALPSGALELVLGELFENSLKFHPQRAPSVDVLAAREAPGRASLVVRDDGASLSPGQLVHILTPYYQAERAHTGQVAGMGLGLPMVATILWNAGGTCRVRNRTDGTGVVVEVLLPLEAAVPSR